MGRTETLPFEQHRENALPLEVGSCNPPLNIRAEHLQHILSILPTLCLGTLSSLNTQCLQCLLYLFASTFLCIFLCLAFSLLFSLLSSSLPFAGTNCVDDLVFYSIFSHIAFVFLFFLYNLWHTFMGVQRFLFCCCFFPIFSLVLPLFFSCIFPIFSWFSLFFLPFFFTQPIVYIGNLYIWGHSRNYSLFPQPCIDIFLDGFFSKCVNMLCGPWKE